MTLRIHLHLIQFILFAFLLIPTVGISQIGTETATIDSVLVKKPVAIPVIDIVQEVSAANTQIKEIEQKIKTEEGITRIDSLLPLYADYIMQRKLSEEHFIKANPNRPKIDNQIDKWLGYRDRLEMLAASINDYVSRNTILLDQISQDQIIWELTYQNALENVVPAEVLNSVKSVVDEFQKLNTTITNENNGYLRLEKEISDQNNIIQGVVDELTSLKNSEVYQLFHLRHPPLWETSVEKKQKDTAENVGAESISNNISVSWNYVKAIKDNIYLFAICLILLIIGILLIKRSFLKYPMINPDNDHKNARQIIVNNTFWVIVFLALILLGFFFPATPKLFDDILVLVMFFCAATLVRPYILKRFRNFAYFIILILVLDFAKTYFWLPSFQYRLYLLLEALLILAVLAYFTYPYRQTRKLGLDSFSTILIRLTPLVSSIVGISLISNILGYTNLTDFTIKLCTRGGVLTFVFYAIWLLAEGIILGYVHYHFYRRQNFDLQKKQSLEFKLLRFVRIVVLLFWLFYFLNLVDLYEPLSDAINQIFTEPYKVGSTSFTLGMVFMFIAILASSFLITSIISFLLDGNDVKLFNLSLPKGIPAAISLVIRYFILAFGFVLALSALEIDLSKFNLMAGALGLGIGFGLQTVVSNFISGIILVFERPILTGDVVEVNNLLGTVSKIGVRSSRINTYDGAEVVVPNNNLISQNLINWTLSDNIKRVEISIGAAYGTDPNQVLTVLSEVASEHADVLKNPPPMTLFDAFGDSSLNFRLLFWVHFQNGLQAKSDISVGIYNKFEELGIKIPFPQREIRMSKDE